MDESGACPCGAGESYGLCCGRLHARLAQAATAEELMRSRYSAFVVGDAEYLLHTWHPATRPAALDVADGTRWTGLEILDAGEEHVEFVASYEGGELREHSRFVRWADGWVYVRGRRLRVRPS